MNRNFSWLAALLLATVPGIAAAQFSSTVTATTDYDFRGITQTAQDPALQLSLDWAGESGVYLGAWASNVDFGSPDPDADIEVDLYGGFGGSIREDLDYDVGAVLYVYEDDEDIDYAEVFAGLSYRMLSGKLWYSPDYLNSTDSAWYAELNAEGPLPAEFGWLVHAGYSGGRFWDDKLNNGLDEYFDYAVGITRSIDRFDLTLKWVDGSNLKEADVGPDENSSEERLIFSVSTTFPWES